MPTKIRLQRFGKKGQPFYRIVVADSRAPRDGKFIELLGTYNPLTKPASISLNEDRALYWLEVGAKPTDTARAILSYKGILLKLHLKKGIKKGALSQEEADRRFQVWLKEKEQKIQQQIKNQQIEQKEQMKKRIEEESKKREEYAKKIAQKQAQHQSEKVSEISDTVSEQSENPTI